MEFLEVLTEGLEKVLMVRGGGREVITIYSWTRCARAPTPLDPASSCTPETRAPPETTLERRRRLIQTVRAAVCRLVAPRLSLKLFTFMKLLCDSISATWCMQACLESTTAVERLPGLTSTRSVILLFLLMNVSSTTIFCWIYCLEWCCFGVYSLLYRYIWRMYEYKEEP